MLTGGISECFILSKRSRVAYFITGNYRYVRFKNLFVKLDRLWAGGIINKYTVGQVHFLHFGDERPFRSATYVDAADSSCQVSKDKPSALKTILRVLLMPAILPGCRYSSARNLYARLAG
jgi:hypothetical protein